jgi:hypothetical protein
VDHAKKLKRLVEAAIVALRDGGSVQYLIRLQGDEETGEGTVS